MVTIARKLQRVELQMGMAWSTDMSHDLRQPKLHRPTSARHFHSTTISIYYSPELHIALTVSASNYNQVHTCSAAIRIVQVISTTFFSPLSHKVQRVHLHHRSASNNNQVHTCPAAITIVKVISTIFFGPLSHKVQRVHLHHQHRIYL